MTSSTGKTSASILKSKNSGLEGKDDYLKIWIGRGQTGPVELSVKYMGVFFWYKVALSTPRIRTVHGKQPTFYRKQYFQALSNEETRKQSQVAVNALASRIVSSQYNPTPC